MKFSNCFFVKIAWDIQEKSKFGELPQFGKSSATFDLYTISLLSVSTLTLEAAIAIIIPRTITTAMTKSMILKAYEPKNIFNFYDIVRFT